MRLLIAYSLVAAVMIFVSCFAGDRRAISTAVLLSVSHVVGVMAWIYLPAAPATILHAIGFMGFTHTETRGVMDGCIAAWVAYRCGREWWGQAIWIALIATGFAHVLHQDYGMGYLAYAFCVNGLFLVMAATLLRIGGRGAVQYVGSIIRRSAARCRHVFHPSQPARQQAGEV